MSNIDQIIRRIRSTQRGKGDHLLTMEAELRRRSNCPSLQEDLQEIFNAFAEDVPLISHVIQIRLTEAAILQHELEHRFSFDYRLCESAITAYSHDETFVTWLIISMHKKSSKQARRIFPLVVSQLSDDSLWSIEEATDDPHMSAIMTPEITKRNKAYLNSEKQTDALISALPN